MTISDTHVYSLTNICSSYLGLAKDSSNFSMIFGLEPQTRKDSNCNNQTDKQLPCQNDISSFFKLYNINHSIVFR